MLQTIAVTVLVIASAGYSAWRLMPGRARAWLVERLLPAAAVRRFGLLARLHRAAQAAAAGGCAGCASSGAPKRTSRSSR